MLSFRAERYCWCGMRRIPDIVSANEYQEMTLGETPCLQSMYSIICNVHRMLQKRISCPELSNLSNMCFSTLIPKPKYEPAHPNQTNLKDDKNNSHYDTDIPKRR